MIRLRVIIAATLSIILFAWADVLIWQRLIEGREWWIVFDGHYHAGMRVLLDAISIGGALLLWGRWPEMVFYPMTIRLLYLFGAADVLYYWLDGRALPADMRWSCDAWHLCALPGPLIGEFEIVANVSAFSFAWALLWFAVWRIVIALQDRARSVRVVAIRRRLPKAPA